MSRPRSRDLGIRVSGRRQWDLESFIALAAPEGRLVGCIRDDLRDVLLFSTALPAIMDRDGNALACLAGAKTITRIDAYGGRAPERLLHEAVGTWLRWERPGIGQLRIEVTYAQPRTKHWRTNRRGSCFVSYDWVGSPLGVSPGPG
jgi:hypothetical protein